VTVIVEFQLFEGMKAYRGVDGKIRIFRPEKNMERMNQSALRAGLPTFDGENLIKCLCQLVSIEQEWVPHSESSSLYIRPTLIGIDVSRFHLLEILPCIHCLDCGLLG
jgi:branched-chain amino acid aminotransferase